MNKKSLLLGLMPLVIFAVMDSFADTSAGVLAAMLFALAEAIWTYKHFKKIDGITLGSLTLVLIFGGLSLVSEDSFFFKIQSVFFGVLFGVLMIILQVLKKPLMVIVIRKYADLFPPDIRKNLHNPALLSRLSLLSALLGPALLIHSGLTVYAIFYLSTWWWLAIRGVGLYIIMGLCVLLVRFKT